MFKVFSVAIFAFVLGEICYADVPFTQDEYSLCEVPTKKLEWDIKKFLNKKWFVQRLLNAADKYDMACAIANYGEAPENGILLKSLYYYKTETGEKDSFQFELNQQKDGRFYLQDLKTLEYRIFGWVVYFEDDILIEKLCFYQGETMYLFQGYMVWSLKQDVDNGTIQAAVDKSEVYVHDTYFVDQGDHCFKYEAGK